MLARWQFGITTVYHFLFVPLTIGLAFTVAGFQTAWYRTGKDEYLRLTRFFGELFLINFAIGVVTGIVQEFQFGMNWSSYCRFVGDIFGAPLAIEGLLAFFLESTFLGLWIFGWDRLPQARPPRDHLDRGHRHAALGVLHPRRQLLDAAPGGLRGQPRHRSRRAHRLPRAPDQQHRADHVPAHDRGRVHDHRGVPRGDRDVPDAQGPATPEDAAPFRSAAKAGAVMLLVSGLLVAVTGDIQGKIMTEQQPMKMAAAEALWETEQPASFSIFTIGTPDGSEDVFSIRIPFLLSFLATGTFDGKVEGINDLQAQEEARFGPGDYTPNTPITYWTFRWMIGMGALAALAAAWFLFRMRKGRTPAGRTVLVAVLLPFLPLAANSFALDVHGDRTPALDRVRPDADGDRGVAERERARGAADDGRLHRSCTAPWRW